MAIVLITHDLGIVRHFAERVAVMRRGEVVEQGTTADIFERPTSDYTKMLLAAEPHRPQGAAGRHCTDHPEGRDVVVDYAIGGGLFLGRCAEVPRGRQGHGAARGRPDHRHRRRIGIGKIDARTCIAAARPTPRAITASVQRTFRL